MTTPMISVGHQILFITVCLIVTLHCLLGTLLLCYFSADTVLMLIGGRDADPRRLSVVLDRYASGKMLDIVWNLHARYFLNVYSPWPSKSLTFGIGVWLVEIFLAIMLLRGAYEAFHLGLAIAMKKRAGSGGKQAEKKGKAMKTAGFKPEKSPIQKSSSPGEQGVQSTRVPEALGSESPQVLSISLIQSNGAPSGPTSPVKPADQAETTIPATNMPTSDVQDKAVNTSDGSTGLSNDAPSASVKSSDSARPNSLSTTLGASPPPSPINPKAIEETFDSMILAGLAAVHADPMKPLFEKAFFEAFEDDDDDGESEGTSHSSSVDNERGEHGKDVEDTLSSLPFMMACRAALLAAIQPAGGNEEERPAGPTSGAAAETSGVSAEAEAENEVDTGKRGDAGKWVEKSEEEEKWAQANVGDDNDDGSVSHMTSTAALTVPPPAHLPREKNPSVEDGSVE